MKDTKVRKKALFLLLIYLSTFSIFRMNSDLKKKVTYNEDYCSSDNNEYASYNNKKIFVNENHVIKQMNIDDDSIYIVDMRNHENPEFKVINSCYINNLYDIENILDVLLKYESDYPSDWDRNFNTMELEWLVHNLCYYLDYKQDRTKDVDLDNEDEEEYKGFKLIKTIEKEINS